MHFPLSDDAVGAQEATIKILGAKSTTDVEVLLFRSTARFTIEPNVYNALSFETWEGNHVSDGAEIPFEFDVNRNSHDLTGPTF